jgi:pimeloyl-ACP methyl ester carboxylesterase
MTDAETGYVEFPGAKIYYEVEGHGPALTLVHAGVAHLRMWDQQVAAWRDRFRIVRYDERGFGRTLTEDVPYSNAEDLLRVLDHVGVDKTHLLGTSRGGSIVTDFTLQHPDRVRSLILVAAGLSGYDVEDDPRLLALWPEMERLETAKEWDALVELETQVWTDGPGQPADRVDPEIRRQMIQWNLENYRAEQIANQVQRMDPPAAQRLNEISVPTLLIWGALDESPVAESGAKMAAEVRGARSHVFEDVAHMVSLERPAEFNRLVGDFLDGVEASDAGHVG